MELLYLVFNAFMCHRLLFFMLRIEDLQQEIGALQEIQQEKAPLSTEANQITLQNESLKRDLGDKRNALEDALKAKVCIVSL